MTKCVVPGVLYKICGFDRGRSGLLDGRFVNVMPAERPRSGNSRRTAAVVVDRGGDSLLAVKDNQPTLHKELIETLSEASDPRRRAYDEAPAAKVETYCTTEKGHGRLEERIVRVCRDLTWVMDRERWKRPAVVVELESRRTDQSSGTT